MNHGKYVFSQIMSLISPTSFQTIVNTYDGDYRTRDFNCWKQFLCMAFGQLTHRESLSDTLLCLAANESKLYHLGIGYAASKSVLSTANKNRDYRIYEDLAMLLIQEAKQLYSNHNDLEIDLVNNVFGVDATTIDMCLSAFSWAKFRTTKAGIKLHTQLDLKTSIPEFIHITPAEVHEVNVMDIINYQADSFYVLDRGYVDFTRLYRIHQSNAFFVIRAKGNLNFKRVYSAIVDKSIGVLCDQKIKLNGFYVSKQYPVKLRRVKFYDAEQNRTFVFLTNNFELKASDIAQLYKHRWKIELFFKWIKQHLKIKSFWGNTENAVKTQIWIAIITYVLVAIAKKRFKVEKSLYEMLQIISINIFDKTQLNQLFKKSDYNNFKEQNTNQLNMFDF
ncbi:MAG: IS4 family transposase [Bacteroidota bacterium]